MSCSTGETSFSVSTLLKCGLCFEEGVNMDLCSEERGRLCEITACLVLTWLYALWLWLFGHVHSYRCGVPALVPPGHTLKLQ